VRWTDDSHDLRETLMPRVAFLSELSADEVRARMRSFADSYKRDWQRWIDTGLSAPLESPGSAEQFRNVLRRWQAVRSKTKGRVVRQCHAGVAEGELCMEELLREAAPFVQELGDFSLREAAMPTVRQERALGFLWDIFRALPSSGTANAVGITKAIKLVSLGRIGPALDTVVRKRLGIVEPRSGEEWITALRSISGDLAKFERRERMPLEALVEERWKPIAVGRAYDMLAGPAGRKPGKRC
jgi:hypothetical protein